MIFSYKTITATGEPAVGEIESVNQDDAVAELQKKGLTVVSINERKSAEFQLMGRKVEAFSFFKPKVKTKDLVIFSRQISTLFEAGVSALRAFRLLSEETDNKALQERIVAVADDIQVGVSLSNALEKQPDLFSPFYVSMIRAGEESGKLNESFLYLADYLDRDYELSQKTRKALTYPAFVVATFVLIMIVMFTFVIPKMAEMFADQGADLPIVTQIIINISNFCVHYGIFLFPLMLAGLWWFYRYSKTPDGKLLVDTMKTKVPVFRTMFQKIFLARLADNMDTMLTSGVSIVRAIEITSNVVDNEVYKALLLRTVDKVKTGTSFSKALYEEPEIPNILVQMVHIGEETGELGYILKSLSKFYKREVDNAIDAVIGLIEPALIVGLGLGVGILVASVLLPMYSLSSAIA